MAIGQCKFFNLLKNTGDYSPGRDGPYGRTVRDFGTCDGDGDLGVVGRPCSDPGRVSRRWKKRCVGDGNYKDVS